MFVILIIFFFGVFILLEFAPRLQNVLKVETSLTGKSRPRPLPDTEAENRIRQAGQNTA